MSASAACLQCAAGRAEHSGVHGVQGLCRRLRGADAYATVGGIRDMERGVSTDRIQNGRSEMA